MQFSDSPPPAPAGAREKLNTRGVESLSDAELLALLLGTGTPEEPVSLLAQRLLCRLGGLQQVARASLHQLGLVKGIGAGKAARIAAGVELGRRVLALPLERGARLASSEDVYRAFGPLLAPNQHEELWAIALDARQRILSRVQLARGGVSSCPATMADVFRPLIREGASGVIVVHNHPSGAPDPSPEDLAFTERLAHAGELLGIMLLDHVIVAADGYFSCLDAGLYRAKVIRRQPPVSADFRSPAAELHASLRSPAEEPRASPGRS